MSNVVLESLNSLDVDTLNGLNTNNREYARKILNYPAMMVPSVQENIMKSLIADLPSKTSLIDPFMGASNTLVTAMRYGVDVYGQDINPLSVLISQVKTHIYDIESLESSYNSILKTLKLSRSTKVDVNFRNIDKWFKRDVQIELSQIRRAILREKNKFIRKFYWVALGEVIRLTSNDRTSTFKMHVRKSEDIDKRKISPKRVFINTCKRSIADLSELKLYLEKANLIENGRYKNNSTVKWGDSKNKIRTNKKYNLLVTSPPYGDNHTTVTYGQFSYLPLQWIPISDIDDLIDIDYLSVIQEIDSRSLGGRLQIDYKKNEERLFDISPSLKNFFEYFTLEEKNKAKKVVAFINDLDITIDNVLKKMELNSYMVWTVGNRNVNNREVKNDNILIELMKNKGVNLFTDLERDILSKRMPGKNNFSSTMNKEKILVFKMGGDV